MKKFTALLLALLLSLSFSAAVLAADEGYVGKDSSAADDGSNTFQSNDASTNVYLKVGDDAGGNLSATVPLFVRLAVTNTDTIVAPTAYKISNTGAIAAKVTHVTATGAGGYTFTKEAFNAAEQLKLNLSLTPTGGAAINLADYTGKTAVPAATAADWNIAAEADLGLLFAGSVHRVGDVTSDTQAFSITYTIAAGTATNTP